MWQLGIILIPSFPHLSHIILLQMIHAVLHHHRYLHQTTQLTMNNLSILFKGTPNVQSQFAFRVNFYLCARVGHPATCNADCGILKFIICQIFILQSLIFRMRVVECPTRAHKIFSHPTFCGMRDDKIIKKLFLRVPTTKITK